MNKFVLLIVLPCLVALVTVSAQWGGDYSQYYHHQLGAYNAQNRLYNYGNQVTAQVKNAKLLNYLFGFLLLLQFTNATGNNNG